MSKLRRALRKPRRDCGFNARIEEFESLDDAGVIDPAKVVRSALENAVSAGVAADNHETAVAETPKKPAPMPATPPGGMGEMGGYGRLRRRRFLVLTIMCSLLSLHTHYLARYCEDEPRFLYFNNFVAVTICVV